MKLPVAHQYHAYEGDEGASRQRAPNRSQPWSQGGGGDWEGYVDFDLLGHITNNHSLQRCHMNLPKCRSIAKS